MAGEDEIVAEILGHTEEYPASLLEMLSKNEETAQFVLDYPDKKDNPPAETIGDVTRGEIPLLIQWDERWGYTTYGSGLLAVTGCGPTCLSMVAAGLNGDSSITPWRVAEFAVENGYYVEGVGSAWSLMTEGCGNTALRAGRSLWTRGPSGMNWRRAMRSFAACCRATLPRLATLSSSPVWMATDLWSTIPTAAFAATTFGAMRSYPGRLGISGPLALHNKDAPGGSRGILLL